jgi:hypothetical protein
MELVGPPGLGPPGPGPSGPGPPGPICGALFEGPTELESLEQPARSTRGAKSRNIKTIGSFFCNMPFVRNMTDEWLYWSDTVACIAGAVAEGGQQPSTLHRS